MAETQGPGPSDGIPSLMEHWKANRGKADQVAAAALQGQNISPLTGTLRVTSSVSAVLSESAQVIMTPGIPSEEQVGTPVVMPDGELIIQAAVIGFADPSTHPLLVRSVTIPWIEILKALEKDPTFLDTLKPRRLEELVAEAYMQQGYKDVVLTPHSDDKGRDVIVTATLPGIGTIRIVDQVKRYAPHRKVIANDVRALAGVLLRDRDVSKGIVTTTSDFAPGIQKEFAPLLPSRLELKNGQVLKHWLNELYSRDKA
jgi:restriction system protein